MNVNELNALMRVHDLGIDARTPLTAARVGEASRWRGHAESSRRPLPGTRPSDRLGVSSPGPRPRHQGLPGEAGRRRRHTT